MKKHPFLHDHFFKTLFQIREIALEHVEDYVPPVLAAHLVIPTFSLDQTVYLNKELQESRSDLVYGCQLDTGQNCRLALLYEHKSKQPERDIRVQTLQYKTSYMVNGRTTK